MKIMNKEEMHQADRYTMDKIGIPGYALMECAAQAMITEIEQYIIETFHEFKAENVTKLHAPSLTILCGSGNNGGDGLVLARRLHGRNLRPKVWMCASPAKIKNQALTAMKAFVNSGFTLNEFSHNNLEELKKTIEKSDYIIDALLGTGSIGLAEEPYRTIIEMVNNSPAKVISIDIPSGSDPDCADNPCSIRSDLTLSVQFPKIGAYLHPGAQNYGKLKIIDAGIRQETEKSKPGTYLWDKSMHEAYKTQELISHQDDYKGKNGRAVIIGGSKNMTGAPLMSAMACARSGAGLISLAIIRDSRISAQILIPESMYLDCKESQGALTDVEIPENTDLVAVGMGMGRNQNSKYLIDKLLKSEYNLLIDGDGLHFLKDIKESLISRKGITVLTPHMGEMAGLCSKDIDYVRRNRFDLSRNFAVKYKVYLVLKGPNTITSCPDGTQYVNQSGNEGLAKGGSGDILAGMIGGRLARISKKMHIYKEAKEKCNINTITGRVIADTVYCHGRASDELIEGGKNIFNMIPTDIIKMI
ncbi:bifunctional ADP-dependent NAD(P)H-hydrate dehydratase/NAD(P)H-hydrate epimerase [Proteocatella sphenisci]|uniref:bifunctional ADP-dependent NAD(P)H-hydrate dehydratase/NAD(P)H-hydrate epimerase n=1 Tax=Proteocatella sphenisci TaxID=181070 RepID=UPI0004910F42|nr:bifunctional ADP-dependent NAD(P)H-hydrate dehydratase/NAD(P)H-hydrate epimerase [Proteocatella sphenisci]